MATTKETVYIEAEDEITAVIDKVTSASNKIVAVVLPKRATVFQSVVNMKLLKKAATEAKKQVVVISSEPAIESIAAIAGVHLAKSLQSKPVIPKRTKQVESEVISSAELDDNLPFVETEEPEEAKFVASESEPAIPEPVAPLPLSAENDTIELDNTDDEAVEVPEGTLAKEAKEKKKKRAFRVPDFSNFKLRMGLGIALVVLLITGWVFGFVILPKATITLNTDTSSSTVTFDFVVSAEAAELNVEKAVVPATKAEVSKQNSATVPATGEKNVGEKATGTLTLANCAKNSEGISIPAGSGFSAGNLTYVTNQAIELGPAVYFGNNCRSEDFPEAGAVKDVGVTATNSGESYNINARSYTSSIAGVTASGTAMSGGTTQVVKVVSAEDVAGAKQKLVGTSTAEAIAELSKTLESQELQAIAETLVEGEPNEKVSAAVDSEVSEVTVTQTVLFSMLGVSTNDLGTLLDSKVTASLEEGAGTNIRRNGLDTAVLRLASAASATNQTLNLQTVAVLGPEFDEAAIRNEVAGMKRGDIEKLLEARGGVRSVSVDYSPIWITTTPKSADKITIVINELEN